MLNIQNLKILLAENRALLHPLDTVKNLYKIFKYSENRQDINYYHSWKKIMIKFILAQPKDLEVIKYFFHADIKKIKTKITDNIEEPILICVVKNDLYRIKILLKHYRKLGVRHFAILDNDSSDGTKEYLMEQSDVDVFLCKDQYTTNKREAWVNRLVDCYGFNRWYLIVDSDELLVYNDDDYHDINELISYLKKKGIYRLRSIMIDMYSKKKIFSKDINSYDQLSYFDVNTYTEQYLNNLICVRGGPRSRIFSENVLLTKYPLVYFDKKTFQGKSHFLFPYKYNNVELCSGLLHFKFLSYDLEKYKIRAELGNYYNNSIQYKKYLEKYKKNESASIFNDINSKKYINSNSIYDINILKKINWDEV